MNANPAILFTQLLKTIFIRRKRRLFQSQKLITACASLIFLHSACINPDIEILPVKSSLEGAVKTLVAQIKPANAFGCDYSTVNVEYREQGSATWINLGFPTAVIGNPGYNTYQIDIPGSSTFRLNQMFEQRWTAHVPTGTGWFSRYTCSTPFDIIRTSSFLVTRAFDISFSPSPLIIPAGLSKNLNINVQRYGSFSDPVTVTAGVSEKSALTVNPESIIINGSSATVNVSAKLDIPPSDISLSFNATSQTATGGSYFARVKIVSPFNLQSSPDPLEIARGGSSPLTVNIQRFAGFNGPVTISFAGLPYGVTASPNSPITVTGNSKQIIFAASMDADINTFHLIINGAALTNVQASDTVTVNVGRPKITSVSPWSVEKGMTFTIFGEGFNPNCYMNTVKIGSIGIVPTSCTSTNITAVVPYEVPFGSTTVSVMSGGLTSNTLPFKVRRKSGDFVNVSGDINLVNNRVCPSGLVRLEITGSSNIYHANYINTSTGASIGYITFAEDSDPYTAPGTNMTEQVCVGIGGAGFASCTTGIVFDAAPANQPPGRVCLQLLDLTRGAFFNSNPYYFNLYTGVEVEYGGVLVYSPGVSPLIYHSPDGSIIALVVASPNGCFRRISFLDQATGGSVFRELDLQGLSGVNITLNSSNQIIFSQEGTTYNPINLD